MGRSRELPLRKDWEKVKDQVMKDVLVAKFTQHDELKQTLLSTGNRTLVEHTENDKYLAYFYLLKKFSLSRYLKLYFICFIYWHLLC